MPAHPALPARRLLPLTAAVALALAGCAGAPSPAADGDSNAATAPATAAATPVDLTNCDEQVAISSPPKRAVTLNQGATEVALALGLQDQMAGTAYLDDAVPQQWKSAYDAVPVLAKEYPSKEQFLAATPDFAYASYQSAFSEKTIGTRAELAQEGVQTYLSPFGCKEAGDAQKATFEKAWGEVEDVAKIFGVDQRAKDLVQEQTTQLETLRSQAAAKGKTIFWFDSGDKTPLAGGATGGPALIMEAIGATNAFADIEKGWGEVTWEKVVAANPDVIVLADANWSTAQSKIDYLKADPVLKNLDAVRAQRFVTVPFSESTPGVRLVDGARTVAQEIAALPAT